MQIVDGDAGEKDGFSRGHNSSQRSLQSNFQKRSPTEKFINATPHDDTPTYTYTTDTRHSDYGDCTIVRHSLPSRRWGGTMRRSPVSGNSTFSTKCSFVIKIIILLLIALARSCTGQACTYYGTVGGTCKSISTCSGAYGPSLTGKTSGCQSIAVRACSFFDARPQPTTLQDPSVQCCLVKQCSASIGTGTCRKTTACRSTAVPGSGCQAFPADTSCCITNIIPTPLPTPVPSTLSPTPSPTPPPSTLSPTPLPAPAPTASLDDLLSSPAPDGMPATGHQVSSKLDDGSLPSPPSGTDVALVAGCAVGGLVFLVVMILLSVVVWKRSHSDRRETPVETAPHVLSTSPSSTSFAQSSADSGRYASSALAFDRGPGPKPYSMFTDAESNRMYSSAS